MRTKLGYLLKFLAITVAIFGTSSAHADEDTIKKINEADGLKVGIRADAPPLGYTDKDGKIVGFAPDLAMAIGEELGVKITLVPTTGQTRIPLLQNKRIDVELGTTTPTKKRDLIVDFPLVYNWDSVVVLVRAGDSKSPADYGAPRSVATTQGSITGDIFKRSVENAEVLLFQEYGDAVNALLSNKTDAVLMNAFTANQYKERYAGKVEVGESFFRDPQGIMTRENESDLSDLLSWTIQKLWADGTYASLYEKHFGFKPMHDMWSANGTQPGVEN